MISGVRWLSVGPGSGYGDASEAYLSGLQGAGVPVSWTPLGWPSPSWNAPHGPVAPADLDGATHADIADRRIEHDTVVVYSTPLWHDALATEASGRRLIAYTTWETDRLPPESVTILNRYDHVLVPSRFNAAVFRSSGVNAPITVIPHIRRPAKHPGPGDDRRMDRTFVFYLIATWSTRKAILDTVSAYLEAFTATDDVALILHTTPVDQIAAARRARSRAPLPRHHEATWYTLAQALAGRRQAPKITLSTRRLPRAEVDALHTQGDCFVSLSRGEGWGLGAFDAGSYGNSVVVTGWGGTLEFLPAGYPYLVHYDLVPTTNEEPDAWWEPHAGEHWAKARTDHAATLMRHVFDHRDEARDWGSTLRSNVNADFSQADVTRRLIAALERS
jgi:glycosyltransferase involved in cell wall biosynthesis